jgi:hypothetical protein
MPDQRREARPAIIFLSVRGRDARFAFALRATFVVWFLEDMSKIEEIERAVEQLPLTDFVKLAVWVDRRRQQLAISPADDNPSQTIVRDHSAFLSSYAPQDEGLYDDAATR